MKLASKLACLSLVAALAACGPGDGYYDSLGNYHSGSRNSKENATVTSGFSGDSYHSNNFYTDASARRGDSKKVVDYDSRRDMDRIAYKRAGYYDYEGAYITGDRAPVVDSYYNPPRGKCRVWFPDRDAEDQPAIESCSRIQNRVPAGAFVIYGGR